MKYKIITAAIAFVLIISAGIESKVYSNQNKQFIQIAILLDTSSSMNGLINQAKTQLWKIVNTMALAKRNGIRPQLQVALYEYGKSNLSRYSGYIKQISQFTSDLDSLSDELFKLSTNGGSEYCGQVIDKATNELNWNNNPKTLKLIYIAGNEAFTQGEISYIKSCKNAIRKGIIVNTIHCGSYQAGVFGKWKHGADLADGSYMNINHNKTMVHIKTPYDSKILKLGTYLNSTYIPYGSFGKTYKSRQMKQDSNAMKSGTQVLVERSISKASGNYVNNSWDLVDAIKNKKLNIDNISKKALPKNMQAMSPQQQKHYIKRMYTERTKLQKQINKLQKQRRVYIAKQRKKDAKTDSLDEAMIKSIKDQAKKKNYKFE